MSLAVTAREPDADSHRDEDLDGRIGAAGLAGATVAHGLLRFHTAESGAEAQRLVALHIGENPAQGMVPIAVDWRARQYCRLRTPEVDTVVRVDPAEFRAGSVLDFTPFMDTVLTDPAAAGVLGQPEFERARRVHGVTELPFAESFGCYTPAFLGGDMEDPANLLTLPTMNYTVAMADVKQQWEARPAGARLASLEPRDGRMRVIFDVDQDPAASPGAGTRTDIIAVTSTEGPEVYNHGLARRLAGDAAATAAENLAGAFGPEAEGTPLLVDWRGRIYVRGTRDGADAVVRYDPATLTAETVGAGEGFLERITTDPALHDLLGEHEKSRQCARLRLPLIPEGYALVPPAPPALTGQDAVDPDDLRAMATDVYWWLVPQLLRAAQELGPERRPQGYLFAPGGVFRLQPAPAGAPGDVAAPPRPWEDTADAPLEPEAPHHVALAETGVHVTALDPHGEAPQGSPEVTEAIEWYGLAGRVHNHGLFRFLDADGAAHARRHLATAFGEAARDAVPVIVDWRGRYVTCEEDDGPAFVSYDVATGDRERLSGFDSGLEQLLTTGVALDLFDDADRRRTFDALGVSELEPGTCVGVKVPPFLGGAQDPENREVDSLETHWMWNGDIYAQLRGMPDGTRVAGVGMDEHGAPVVRFVDAPAEPMPAQPAPAADRTAPEGARSEAAEEPPAPEDPAEKRGLFRRMFKG
ncbi:hypothetical protein [Micrococcus sp.]|uniref:hypothetical protein n=1 Tax=Micrococcus sp. TaxID=1271 RepID=UPI0026DC983A|nr:hypothetical protein [Micrococcus sp.]MDO4239243.1 hypothetical protein [Micrococcus sp.]